MAKETVNTHAYIKQFPIFKIMIMWVIDIHLFAFLLNRLYGRYLDFIDVWMSVEYKPVAIQKKKKVIR